MCDQKQCIAEIMDFVDIEERKRFILKYCFNLLIFHLSFC